MLPDLPQMNDTELENFVQLGGSFECEGTSCQCCVNVGFDYMEGQYKILSVIVNLTLIYIVTPMYI